MHTLVKKTDTTILYQVTPGKPDPKEMAQEEGEMRGRVVQKSKKGPCCWYYGLNFLRKRIGPIHAPGLKDARDIEKGISSIRKKIEDSYQKMPTITESLELDGIKDYLKLINQKNATTSIANWNRSVLKLRLEDPLKQNDPDYKSFLPELNTFSKNPQNTSNFYEYLFKIKYMSIMNCFQKVLEEFGVDSKIKYEEINIPAFKDIPFESLDSLEKFATLQYLFFLTAIEKYKLSIASWRPIDGFDKLKISIEEHGPHYFSGGLGIKQYKEPPFRLEQPIGNRSIWAWKKGTAKKEQENVGHVVIVVGALETTAAKFIYFIDPQDESNPKDIEKQKIYAVSYSTFVERICNLAGIFHSDKEDKDTDILSYAVHP